VPSAISAEKLRVSYASVTGNTAVLTYIAQRAGLFEKQGLDVEIILITGGPAAVSALLNGDVDLDLRAPVAAIQAMAHGAKLTFLLSQSNTLEYDVVTRPEIKDVKQLKGKRIGIIRFGGLSALMVRYLFQNRDEVLIKISPLSRLAKLFRIDGKQWRPRSFLPEL
jgi:NitT/TauT family transport system substrate-binding protein